MNLGGPSEETYRKRQAGYTTKSGVIKSLCHAFLKLSSTDGVSNTVVLIGGSLSTCVFETRTATGREHFTCQDSGVSRIFLLIIPNGEKILIDIKVVVEQTSYNGKQPTSGCRSRLKNVHA